VALSVKLVSLPYKCTIKVYICPITLKLSLSLPASQDKLCGGGDYNKLTFVFTLPIEEVERVGGNLYLQSPDQLTDQNLATFTALNTVGGEVAIVTIPNLVSLNGLSLLSRYGGFSFTTTSTWEIIPV
jgi:hypothetical protein